MYDIPKYFIDNCNSEASAWSTIFEDSVKSNPMGLTMDHIIKYIFEGSLSNFKGSYDKNTDTLTLTSKYINHSDTLKRLQSISKSKTDKSVSWTVSSFLENVNKIKNTIDSSTVPVSKNYRHRSFANNYKLLYIDEFNDGSHIHVHTVPEDYIVKDEDREFTSKIEIGTKDCIHLTKSDDLLI